MSHSTFVLVSKLCYLAQFSTVYVLENEKESQVHSVNRAPFASLMVNGLKSRKDWWISDAKSDHLL